MVLDGSINVSNSVNSMDESTVIFLHPLQQIISRSKLPSLSHASNFIVNHAQNLKNLTKNFCKKYNNFH